MTSEVEALVVGAGPAGSAAAIVLARAGVEALVVDRARFPRDKCCGDGLTTLALRELEALGLAPEAVPSWMRVDRAVVRSPSGRVVEFPLPTSTGTYAAVARRRELDNELVELTRAEGVKVADGCAITGLDVDATGAAVETTTTGPIRARWIVAADGMWSPVRRLLGLAEPGYRGEWHAFRQYFAGVTERAANELVIWFDPDLLPGYAWSFPLADGRCNVGFGIQRGGRHRVGDMKQLWPEILNRAHVREHLGPRAEAESPHRAWPIPARVGRSPLVGPRTMFVGDAAAVTDPMTGEGIGQALMTGRIAAEAIARSGSSEPTSAYEERVRAELTADDRMARLLVPFLRRPRLASASIRLAGTSDWTRRNFARWMFEDYPRAMIATPRRWHRGMFTGPGAFR